jgi:hypothetical protein
MSCIAASAVLGEAPLRRGLYGLDSHQAFAFFDDNGTTVPIGSGVNASRYLAAQGLSAIDIAGATMFVIAFDTKLRAPVLLAIPLETGVASPVLELPFGEDKDAIGARQVMTFAPDTDLVIVGGVVESGATVFATVRPDGANYTVFASLPTNVSVSLDTSQAVYFPSTRVLVVLLTGVNPPYARLLAAISTQTGAVGYLPNGFNPNVNTLNYDPLTGDAFGLGSIGQDESTRVTIRLDATSLIASVVGVVHGYTDSLGGYSTLDTDARSIFWLGAESGNDDGFYILNVALTKNATVLSAGLICASSLGACPTTFEYYSDTAQ